MPGVSQIEIHETSQTLKALMREQPTIETRERLHALYLLRSGEAESVTHAAAILCRDRTTVQRWLGKYQQGGIAKLIAERTGQGRKSKVPEAVSLELQAQLASETGFGSYQEVQEWLSARGVNLTYGGTHYYVHDYLGATPKVPRPRSTEQDPERVALFKKT